MRHRKLSMPELNRVDIDTFRLQPKRPIVLMLDNVRSLQNVGAMFGIESLALCGITGCPPHRELHNAALGAEDSVAWQYFTTTEEAITHFRTEGYKILVLEQCEGSILLNQVEFNIADKWVFVVGNEVDGVIQAVASDADLCVEIPQCGTNHSLNVATAAGILLWEWLRDTW